MNPADMRILLTGATGGIGQALAIALVGMGAEVVLHGRRIERLQAAVQNGALENCAIIAGDLTSANDRDSIAAFAAERGVNVLINNAGINQFGLFEGADVAHLHEVNVIAPMQLTQALLPHLRQQPEAMIVNVGSTFGTIGYPGYVAYCATKHAIKGFSEALSRELSDSTVQVLYASPRATATDMNAASAQQANDALGVSTDDPVQVAAMIAGMILRKQSRLQIGWPEKLQVKLNAMFPSLVDGAIAKQLPVIKQFVT